ncbi:MAG: outer membrane protein assembly factor BamC [Gammaproteobacteria bacterium]
MSNAYALTKAVITIFSGLLLLVSCSATDDKAVYEHVAEERPLTVPPDMVIPQQNSALSVPQIAPQSASYKVYSQQKSQNGSNEGLLKTQTSGIKLVRDGAIRWLEIDAKPEDIWKKTIDFFEATGFQIAVKKPNLGIIETDWLENRATSPTNWFTKMFYSAKYFDKYRVRLERNQNNTKTLMFLTHQGAKKGETEDKDVKADIVLVPRDSEPELEFEMLQQFLVYLGNDKNHVKKVLAKEASEKRTKLITTDKDLNLLIVKEIFSRTWRRTGLAIDRLGFTVEDKNRSAGIYYINISDTFIESEKKTEGFFSGLFTKEQQKISQFIISLDDKKDETHIKVLTRQGDENKSPLQKRILEKLDELLK